MLPRWKYKEATLFYYFKGKQELLTAVLTERDKRGADIGGDGNVLMKPPARG